MRTDAARPPVAPPAPALAAAPPALALAVALIALALPPRAVAQDAGAPAADRHGGSLTVPAVPRQAPPYWGQRLRTEVDGALTAGSSRVWVGPPVPPYVPLLDGVAELFLLDPDGTSGHLAFYREPYGAGACNVPGTANCGFVAAYYEASGVRRWRVDLGALLSRPDRLEVQDVRLGPGGLLFFNEACQSYSREAGGQCSALVAVDPARSHVVWRTRPLLSNGSFDVAGDYLVTSYGFTSEKDFVSIVRARDGRVMQRLRVDAMATNLHVERGAAGLEAVFDVYGRGAFRVAITGETGPSPHLSVAGRPPPRGP